MDDRILDQAVIYLLEELLRGQRKTMATLADIQAAQTETLAAVAVQTGIINEAVTDLQELEAKLADAIKANDPVALQAVVDGFHQVTASMQTSGQTLSAALPPPSPTPPVTTSPAAPASP